MANFKQLWSDPASDLMLSSNEVHVWRVSLRTSAKRAQELAQILSDDESKRAARFYFERDRRRFIVGRAALRSILGQYLTTEAGLLQFSYGPQGKPYLPAQFEGQSISFNLAHSHELALLGFTRDREIGVDLEYLRRLQDMEQVAARFFSAQENVILQSLPLNQRQRAFFNCWTRKEAYIKAIGEGLAMPLDKFDVSLAPGEPAALMRVENDPEEASRWTMQALEPAPGYVAALAVEGQDWRCTLWRWPG